ncbi:DNA replication/repair protein RecF [Cycloclasticus sp. P1]|uniref:DNA replication/repair protein RecF n=1 Tax=Cycloclasticus sp. (strain P1) TaxID=385025 RepID=UPI000286A7FF|nr:DNA replication/repair protein RecF [Cycloclasticus sp. P1]AFT66044.1 DNA replication and repair protein recF [Cycloclasticus sp. P1]
MSLVDVQIKDVRNIENIIFQPSPKLNIIVGPNGSGKTSILESLYILSRARSFRTQNITKVLSHNKDSLIVFAQLAYVNVSHKIAIKKNKHKTIIRINARSEKKSSELSRLFHAHLIRPESQTLLENGGVDRRAFIDTGVFHVKHSFLNISKQYNHLLKQRNKLLKTKQLDTLTVWNNKLIEYGTIVSHEREKYLELLDKELKGIACQFIGDAEVTLNYLKGWDKSLSFEDALNKAKDRDILYGFTTAGAHKADIKVLVNGRLAQDYLSRGQMKLLVIAMYLAQIKLMRDRVSKSVCVLLDDLGAELDRENVRKVMFFLQKLNIQTFVTTTNIDLFLEFIDAKETKVFHVKRGVMQIEDS